MVFKRYTSLLISTNLFVQSISPAFAMLEEEQPQLRSKLSITKIQNISDMDQTVGIVVQPGDWLILDIDETILQRGKDSNQEILNLDPKVVEMVKNWQALNQIEKNPQKHITTLFLTARKLKYVKKTREQLKTIGFPEDIEIIFAPNDREGSTKTPTKGRALNKRLEEASIKPRRMIVVDDLKVNLADILNSLQNNEVHKHIPLKLVQRRTNTKICESSEIANQFPKKLTNLTYVKHIGGGSGGVHVLRNAEGQLFTFKAADHYKQIQEEALTDALYRSLGARAPAFAVYDSLPDLQELREACTGPGPYRLAQFIEEDEKANADKCAEKMREHFVIDALLSNWDIAIGGFKNVILDKQGHLWRVDNGGALRYRACGGSKFGFENWNPFKVQELETMRAKEEGASVYGCLTEDDLKEQTLKILEKSPALFSTLDEMARKLHLIDPGEVKEMLRRRLDDLVERFLRTPASPELQFFDGFIAPRFGAGILSYCIHPVTRQISILLGKRVKHRWWCNPGGASDLQQGVIPDKTLAHTAGREVSEETLGYLSYTPQELEQMPSHGILNSAGVFYRMYMAPHPYVSVEQLETATPVPDYGWKHEYSEYRWVPLDQLRLGLEHDHRVTEESKETIQIDDMILYPYFWEMLKEFPVKRALKKISKGKKTRAKHTYDEHVQKMPSPLSVEEEEQYLADVTVKKSFVLGDIKNLATKDAVEHSDDVKSMSGFLPEDEAEALREHLRKAPYTQAQAYMRYRMGQEVFDSLGGSSDLEVDTFLKSHFRFASEIDTSDSHYTSVLKQAHEAEKQNRGMMSFRHGTDSWTCFLWDIFSACRSRLKNLGASQLKTLRILENKFSSIFDVENFIKEYTVNGSVSNYKEIGDVHYADCGLSVNPFGFGNDGNSTSNTEYLFYNTTSVSPTNQEKLFNAFMKLTGIPGNFMDYQALFQQYYQRDNKDNSKLFLFFIDPLVVDCVSYMAVSGGDVLPVEMDGQPYHGFAKTMAKIRYNPEAGDEIIQNRLSGKLSIIRDLNKLQGRLYLHPKIFLQQGTYLDPQYVTIKTWWRHPFPAVDEAVFYQKLNGLVSQNLTDWLPQHDRLDDQAFVEGVPALKRSYRYVYEGQMGLPYKEQELKSLLLPAIKSGNVRLLKEILEKNPEIDINDPAQDMSYRRAGTTTLLPLRALTIDTPHFSEILKIFVDRGLKSIDQIYVSDVQNKILNELFVYKNNLHVELLDSFNRVLTSSTSNIDLVDCVQKKYVNLVSCIFDEMAKLYAQATAAGTAIHLHDVVYAHTGLRSELRLFEFINILDQDDEKTFQNTAWFGMLWKKYISSPEAILKLALQKEQWSYISKIIKTVEMTDLDLTPLHVKLFEESQWYQALFEGLKDNGTIQNLVIPQHLMEDLLVDLMSSPSGTFTNAPWFQKARDAIFRDPASYLAHARKKRKYGAIIALLEQAPTAIPLGQHFKHPGDWFGAIINVLSKDGPYSQLDLSGLQMGYTEYISKLTNALKTNTNLKVLNLKDCSLLRDDAKTFVDGLRNNITLENLILSEEETMDVLGHLIQDPTGKFWDAPWFKSTWQNIIDHPEPSMKHADSEKHDKFLFQLVGDLKVEALDLTFFDPYNRFWIEPVFKGLKHNKITQKVKVRLRDFAEEKNMEQLVALFKPNSSLKHLELCGNFSDIDEGSKKRLIELLKTKTSLEDLTFPTLSAKLEILNTLHPDISQLSGGIKKWAEKSYEELLANPMAHIKQCLNAKADHLVSRLFSSITELTLDSLYTVPQCFFDSLKTNQTISILDLEFCDFWHYSPTEELASLLKESDKVHTLRLRHHLSHKDATSLKKLFVENEAFKTLELLPVPDRNNVLAPDVITILADAMRQTNFSKILKVSAENQHALLNELIVDKDHMSPHWLEWLQSVWGDLSTHPQTGLRNAIAYEYKNLALAILETCEDCDLDMGCRYLSPTSHALLMNILKTNKTIKSFTLDDSSHTIFMALWPLKESLSSGVQTWIQTRWDALMENPEESLTHALGEYSPNKKLIELILNESTIKSLSLSDMYRDNIGVLFNELEDNNSLENLKISGNARYVSHVFQEINAKTLFLKTMDLRKFIFDHKITTYYFKSIKSFLKDYKGLKLIMSQEAFDEELLSNLQTSSFIKSGQLVIESAPAVKDEDR
jgi:hypothetical protein